MQHNEVNAQLKSCAFFVWLSKWTKYVGEFWKFFYLTTLKKGDIIIKLSDGASLEAENFGKIFSKKFEKTLDKRFDK